MTTLCSLLTLPNGLTSSNFTTVNRRNENKGGEAGARYITTIGSLFIVDLHLSVTTIPQNLIICMIGKKGDFENFLFFSLADYGTYHIHILYTS